MSLRRIASRAVRQEAAELAFLRPHPEHVSNGDESAHRNSAGLNYIACFHKGLEHNALGEVIPASYRALLGAVNAGDSAGFDKVPLAPVPAGRTGRKLANPLAAMAFELAGPDSHSMAAPPAPRLDSAEIAAEMAELYWMALLRDVPFEDYAPGQPLVDAATAGMSAMSDFRGPKEGGAVTANTLFRGDTRGDLVGPFISQFLYKRVVFGTLSYNQRQQTTVAGSDFMMNYAEWLDIQNGLAPLAAHSYDPIRRYIRNLRDLAIYDQIDQLYQAFLNACLVLMSLGAPSDHGNPYREAKTQDGFATLGGPNILALVCEVATRALKAMWFQKWNVHRRLRPEAFSGLVHNHATGAAVYPLHPEITDTSAGGVLDRIRTRNAPHNTYLLPMAYPEGSPMHPAYGAGHAIIAAACTTVLKAWFDESWVIPNPEVPNASGTVLQPYAGPGVLTVGGELDKLAGNISIGRNAAGVHWRTDYTSALKLGEEVAIGYMREQKLCYAEKYALHLTKFDGTSVEI